MLKLVLISCVLAAASANLGIAHLAYTAPFAYSAPLLAPYNYRGPLSLAPGQPANILAVDGRPLDTLDVNLDRSAHFTAKALGGVHLLKKRSAALIAPIAPSTHVAHTPLIAPISPLAVNRIAPYSPYTAYTAPYTTYW